MKTANKLITADIFISIMLVLFAVIPAVANAQYGCSYHSYQRCMGNNLYWYDSCGTQQDLAQYCQNGCSNNSCQNNYNNYSNCTYHAYRLCSGNNIYWYDSCGTQQDLYNSCSGGLFCQYGQCVTSIQNYNQNYNNNYSGSYQPYYRTACSGNNIYWYDSLGVNSGLYKKCQDSNSCTADTCSANKCSNIKKCDGSTCAVGSADYNTYCLPAEAQSAKEGVTTPANPANNRNNCGNELCEPILGETSANCPNDCKINTANGLSVSFFAKQNSSSNQWQKASEIGSNSNIYFMISVSNNSTSQIDNVNISANIPSEISSLGNLQLNGVLVSGDIITGINIGSIAPESDKSITFEGKTQTISGVATKQAIVTSNVSGITQTDTISINLNPSQNQAAAAVSSAPATSGFWAFLKHWYLWILVGLALIFLFIVVFRRLSSNI